MIPNLLVKLFGPNWKTLVSGAGTAIFGALTTLASLPYTLGDIATIIPPEWKPIVFKYSLIATVILKFWNSLAQKSKNVTGGTVPQTWEAESRANSPKI